MNASETKPTHFRVEWKEDKGRAEFRVRPDEEEKSEKLEETVPPAAPADSFAPTFKNFVNSILGYVELLPIAAVMYPIMSKDIFSDMKNFLSSNATEVVKGDDTDIFRIPVDRLPAFRQLRNALEAVDHVGNQVPKMLLMGIISSFEYHVSELVRVILRNRPQIIESSSKTVPLSDVLQANSFEEFRANLVDSAIDDLMRQSFEDQIKWFEEKLKIDKISDTFKDWSKLVEVLERRNLFAHTNGIVSDIYLRNGKRHKFLTEDIKKGQELFVSPSYLISSMENVTLFLIMLMQVVWRKVDRDTEKLADDLLGRFGFDLIERGEYRLAIQVLEFARSLRGGKSQERKLTDLVNLANSYRLAKQEKESFAVLDSEDWSAVGDKFLVCVAAVRGDISTCIDVMTRLGANGAIEATDYEEWPVFLGVRDQESFKRKFEEVFGRQYVPSPRLGKRIISSLAGRKRSKKDTRKADAIPELSEVGVTPAPS